MTQIRAVAIAAFFLGIGLAGEPLRPLQALIAAIIVAVLAFALARPGTPLQIFVVALFGVLASTAVAHAFIGPSERPTTFAQQLYLNVYPGTGVVGIGLGLLGSASQGRKHAPAFIAAIGAIVGIGLFFLL